MSGTINLQSIFAMLAECAKGHKVVLGEHNYIVYYNDKVYTRLPKGSHKRNKAEIQKGYVRQLVNNLEIDKECARSYLPALRH